MNCAVAILRMVQDFPFSCSPFGISLPRWRRAVLRHEMDCDAMTAFWDTESLIGNANPRKSIADQLHWMRAALAYVEYTEEDFMKLASKVGAHAAAEIVLLMVARRNTQPADYPASQRLGIPWNPKNWSGLKKIIEKYNKMVNLVMPRISETGLPAQSSSSNEVASEDVLLSDSHLPDLALEADETTSWLGDDAATSLLGDGPWDVFPPLSKPGPRPQLVPASSLPKSPYAPRPGLLPLNRPPPALPAEPSTATATAREGQHAPDATPQANMLPSTSVVK